MRSKQGVGRQFGRVTVFKPRSVLMREIEIIALRLDELEAMWLCDLERLDQGAAAQRIGVSGGRGQRLF